MENTVSKLLALAALSSSLLLLPSSEATAQTIEAQGGATVTTSAPAPMPAPAPRYRRRPGPRLMAPTKINIGGLGANSTQGFLSGVEASVGVHWASLSPRPTNFDIGLGVFGGVMESATPKDKNKPGAVLAGGYLEFGKTLSQGDFWRTWAAGRAEMFEYDSFGKQGEGVGASGRLEAELYLSGVGLAPNGIFLGTYAIGVYVEAAARQMEDVSLLQVGAGLSIRTPLVWGW